MKIDKVEDERLDYYTWESGDVIITFPSEEARNAAYGKPEVPPLDEAEGKK